MTYVDKMEVDSKEFEEFVKLMYAEENGVSEQLHEKLVDLIKTSGNMHKFCELFRNVEATDGRYYISSEDA